MTHDRRIEHRISEWLLEEAPQELPDRVLHATFERTRTRPQRSRGVGWRTLRMPRLATALAAGAAIIVAVAAGIGLLRAPSLSVGGPATPSPSSPVSATPSATASATPSASTSAGPSPSPYAMTALELDTFPVPGAFAVAAADGAVWATSTDGLVRIDEETGETQTFTLDTVEVNGLRAGDSALWVSDYGASAVYEVDPETGELVDTIDLPSGPYSISVDGDELYVVLANETLVFDVGSKEVVREQLISGGYPNPLAFGSVWIESVNRVLRFDAETFELETGVEVPPPADLCTAWPLEAVDGIGDSVVFGCFEGRYLTRIDAETNTHAGTYDIGLNGGSSIAAAGGWWAPVGTSDAPGLARIDPASGAVVEVRALGTNNLTAGMTTASDALWIAAPDSGRVLRIPFRALAP